MFEIFPLFPNVVSANLLNVDLTDFKESLKKQNFLDLGKYDCQKSYASEDITILDKNLTIKNLILDNFNSFKNNVLRLTTTSFKITTSWATKTTTGGFSHLHFHKNSFYSAVLYLDDVDSGGNLCFENYGIKPDFFMLNDPAEWNVYNIEKFEIRPEKNLIVYFPSYLRHRITEYKGKTDRYSVAVNFFPIGNFGYGDSSIELS